MDIEVAKAFQPGVCNDRNGRISLHREGLPAEKFPFRHPAPLLVHIDHRADHIQLPLRIDQSHQLMEVPVCVPQ